jgi:hypothetical protein
VIEPSEPTETPKTAKSPQEELEALIKEQAADDTDPGLTDVEPGAENILDRPEYQELIEGARQAMHDLPAPRGQKTVAGTEGGAPHESGWSDSPGYEGKQQATEGAITEGAEAGYEPEPHFRDPKASAGEGTYHGSHAEKQAAYASPDKPIGVSRAMCPDCQPWFRARAIERGTPQVVSDPDVAHVFLPDGRHIPVPHPPGTPGPRTP